MQQKEIIASMNAKRIRGIADFQDIESLSDRFPYCSTFQTLKAIGLKEQDSIEFKTQLNRASIAIQDRSKLYEYIVKENFLSRIEESEAEESETKEKVILQSSPVKESDQPNSNSKANESREENEILSPETKSEISSPTATTDESDSEHFKTETLEDQIMREAITQLGEMETDMRFSEMASIDQQGEMSMPTKSDAASEPNSDEPLSFGAWLLKKDNKDTQKAPEDRHIIDKFIQESPQITPVKKAFFSPSQMGKLSLIEDESFVTETLAGIYERQGDFKKAAKAYKNLGLKFPEKRLYFADLQKRAEEQIK